MTIDTDNLTLASLIEFVRTLSRNFIFGPNANLDADGNLSVGGTLNSDVATWPGARMVLKSFTLAELPVPPAAPAVAVNCDGIWLVSDATDPVSGAILVGGGNRAALVSFDTANWRVL